MRWRITGCGSTSFRKGGQLDSHIVDIGCGCGKSAAVLRDFSYADICFSGHYYGYDIDPDQVEWCSAHFPADRFTFSTVSGRSTVYPSFGHPRVTKSLSACEDSSIDFGFSQSLFSHLLEEDIGSYMKESLRVLKPGRSMCMTLFCLEDMQELGLLGKRWTFCHKRGQAYVENESYPEAAVAYQRSTILRLAGAIGFSSYQVVLPNFQSSILCTK